MASFLVQTVDGQVKTDFGFALVEAIDYQNWYNAGSHDLHLADSVPESGFSSYIPCGTIQFMLRYLSLYRDIDSLKPINIPDQLFDRKYLKRNVECMIKSDLNLGEGKFVKSRDTLKGYVGVTNDLAEVPDVNLIVSDLINIDSEWRAFVFNGRLVGIHNYSGDFTVFPDVGFIEDCLKAYTDCPPAYTLDVGVNSIDGTFLIEVHNFYSCGVYGFSDGRILPQMFGASFRHLVQKGW